MSTSGVVCSGCQLDLADTFLASMSRCRYSVVLWAPAEFALILALNQPAVFSSPIRSFLVAPYDILMIVVFAGAIIFGWWKGLAWQIASLAALLVSYFVAIQFREPLTKLLNLNQPWAPFLSMLILYLGTSFVIWIGYGYLRQTLKAFQLKEFDAHAGAVLGAIKGALLCMILTLFAVTLLGDNVRRLIIHSKSGGLIARSINQLNAVVPDELHAILDPYVDKFNSELAQPLPPTGDSDSGDWLGKLLPGAQERKNSAESPFQFGSFARPGSDRN